MNLRSLLVCSDGRIFRVLRRVLDEFEIEVEHCSDPTAATNLLARRAFEAVIVDCAEERSLLLLKSIHIGQCNKKSVAIIDEQTALRRAHFGMGAHFVVFKPISCARTKASFRAAKALMKRERRRFVHVPVRIPVSLGYQNGEGQNRSL
jgi:DNA-binding NtrC family response regulator